MANPVSFKFDSSEFDRTLRRYREFSKKDPAEICNTKAFFIARGATRLTPKADRAKIAAELGELVKMGKKRVISHLTRADSAAVPLVALIINKQRGKGKGLYGAEMAEAMRKFIGRRMSSIAFLKSGWLPAIKALAALVPNKRGAPSLDRSAKVHGVEKGSAKPAREGGWKAVAQIVNSAGANQNNRGALITYGAPALQQAVEDETRSMLAYMEKKMKETADKAGVGHG